MTGSWLANADPKSAWAHQPWTAFGQLAQDGECLVILPVHGFARHATGLPMDQEELVGSELLRQALQAVSPHFRCLVLPPLRFLPSTGPDSLFSVDFDTAYAVGMAVSRDVRASGFTKLVLFNTSPGNTGFVSTLAIDARAEFGLRTYVVHGRELGLPLGGPPALEQAADLLTGLLAEIREHQSSALSTRPGSMCFENRQAGSVFPAYRPFYMAAERLSRLNTLPDREHIRVIIPTASIEQHGHHLPVGVDAILGQAQLQAALAGLPPEAPVLVTPPITYGKSNEHKGFPGTLSIGACTLRAIVSALVAQVRLLGFNHIQIFNTHGGNTAVLEGLLRELSGPGRGTLGLLRSSFRPQLAPQEAAWGMHADEWETSLMLACSPELVDMGKAVCEYPAHLEAPGLLRPEKAPATFAWLTSDVSRTGVLGDPRGATLEKGRTWLAAEGEALQRLILS